MMEFESTSIYGVYYDTDTSISDTNYNDAKYVFNANGLLLFHMLESAIICLMVSSHSEFGFGLVLGFWIGLGLVWIFVLNLVWMYLLIVFGCHLYSIFHSS
ncbi:hypothetical protein Droror1_Dr00025352 [Drosera rotundifolia]